MLQVKAPAYYMGTGAPSTLPRGGSLMRAFSPAAPPAAADRASTLPGAGTTTPLILHLHFVRVLPQASSRNPHGIRSEMSFRLQQVGIAFIFLSILTHIRRTFNARQKVCMKVHLVTRSRSRVQRAGL